MPSLSSQRSHVDVFPRASGKPPDTFTRTVRLTSHGGLLTTVLPFFDSLGSALGELVLNMVTLGAFRIRCSESFFLLPESISFFFLAAPFRAPRFRLHHFSWHLVNCISLSLPLPRDAQWMWMPWRKGVACGSLDSKIFPIYISLHFHVASLTNAFNTSMNIIHLCSTPCHYTVR